MFLNFKTKVMASFLCRYITEIRKELINIFDNSIPGVCNELSFINNLTNKLNNCFNNTKFPGVKFYCRVSKIHAKPIVELSSGRCEIGDLLVVVKYKLSDESFEKKSIIYQIKLTQKNKPKVCIIDKVQLDLLCDWPQFSFGKDISGKPINYNIKPLTSEFGSFMLEPRNATKGSYLWGTYKCYGKCPCALLVRLLGPTQVNIGKLPCARGDVDNFIAHLTFKIGEHHSNQGVADFIDALYKYVGLSPDPPGEFDEYSGTNREDGGFAVAEITVEAG